MEDFTGKVFGKLTVIGKGKPVKDTKGYNKHTWECLCECGKTTEVIHGNLTRKKPTSSCGCMRGYHKNGVRSHPLYSTWDGIKQRCANPNHTAYHHYGGRGIKMCPEWYNSSTKFIAWAESNGWYEGCDLTIDRIDTNGNYEPENCRWVDWYVQGSNKRLPKTNTSGHKGVSYRKSSDKWEAKLEVKGVVNYLGLYQTKEEAIKARIEAETKYYGKPLQED